MAVLEGKQDVREEMHVQRQPPGFWCRTRNKVGDKPGGEGMKDNESPFRQADEQSFHDSVTQTGPQGWCGSWLRLLAISIAA